VAGTLRAMFRASLPALAILAAAGQLAACQGVPPTVRARILVPSSLDAACLRAWAVPVYGQLKESPPILRDGRPQVAIDAGRGPSGIALGDLNGDLRLDIAVENQIDATWTPLINQCF